MQWQGPRRSRAIWDETRKPNAKRGALAKAILYELQPIRLPTMDIHSLQSCVVKWSINVGFVCRSLVLVWLPSWMGIVWKFSRNRSVREWSFIGAALAYWKLVVFLHRTLDAGPSFLMLSAIIAIFTIGLGDNSNSGQLSAYSVFNRGFQSLLGDLDADALVQQHVGGGAAVGGMAMGAAVNHRNNNHHNDGAMEDHHQAGQHQDDAQNEVLRQLQVPPEQNENQQEQQPPNRARKSGKKARRKQKLNQRHDIRRQREVAAAMGFGQNEEEDVMAMNRLIEEQTAFVPPHPEVEEEQH